MNDLELFLEPDPDFENRLKEQSSVKVEASGLLQSKTVFPEIISGILDEPDLELPVVQKHNWTKSNSSIFPEINFLDGEKSDTSVVEKPEEYLSEIEKQKSFYSMRFQEILKINSNESLEIYIKRYAKIMLYILEQFHIFENDKKHHNWDKKYFIKFMIDLKKFLGEISTIKEEEDYKENILKKWYTKLSWELKEEIELLFNIYHESYIDCQKQIHEKIRLDEIEKRKKLEKNISQIYEEMNSEFNLDNPNETPAQREARLRREELAKKRVQRDSQLSQ